MRNDQPTFPIIVSLALTGVSLLRAQAQPPVIRAGSVVNAASHISPGLPNYGVAQGSMFIVKGQGLSARTPSSTAWRVCAPSCSNVSAPPFPLMVDRIGLNTTYAFRKSYEFHPVNGANVVHRHSWAGDLAGRNRRH